MHNYVYITIVENTLYKSTKKSSFYSYEIKI